MGMGWVGLGFFVPIKLGFCKRFHCIIFNAQSWTVVKVLPSPPRIQWGRCYFCQIVDQITNKNMIRCSQHVIRVSVYISYIFSQEDWCVGDGGMGREEVKLNELGR